MENHTPMTNKTQKTNKLRVAGLDTQNPTGFELTPAAPVRKAIAKQLGLVELRKLRFHGQINATGDTDWLLKAQLGATVVQPCVLTLAPVSTRLDLPVTRLFVGAQQIQSDTDEEIEIPAGDDSEPLKSHVDLMAVMIEALSLALPLYPKAEGANLETSTFAEKGIDPMSDEAARPFSGLASLRDKLEKDE